MSASSTQKRKIQDVLETIKRAVEAKNPVNALTVLENIAKEANVYVKFKMEDVLALYVENLPHSIGYEITVIMRNGVAVVYELFRDREDYIERVQLYVRRV